MFFVGALFPLLSPPLSLPPYLTDPSRAFVLSRLWSLSFRAISISLRGPILYSSLSSMPPFFRLSALYIILIALGIRCDVDV